MQKNGITIPDGLCDRLAKRLKGTLTASEGERRDSNFSIKLHGAITLSKIKQTVEEFYGAHGFTFTWDRTIECSGYATVKKNGGIAVQIAVIITYHTMGDCSPEHIFAATIVQ